MIAHCFFEQSGTFKNEFKKLGIKAYDYDILNRFNETDYVIDLFTEINKAYEGIPSIFDNIKQDDIIIAFFPCIRFCVQALLSFNCLTPQLKKWDLEKQLEYSMNLHNELNQYYELITKFVIVGIRKNLKIIIENPYSKDHYLTKYWPFKSHIHDLDRTTRGDLMKKPTQYWFLNCKPKCNYVDEEVNIIQETLKEKNLTQVQRSMINPNYARRFIKEFIL